MTQIRKMSKRFDLLSLPLIGAFLRWPYARAALQIPLLLLALLAMYDGFTGNQIAPKNLATTATWLHYRGWVVVALALVGNLFCAACPLMLTRGPSKWLKRIFKLERFTLPRALKNKYPIIVITVLYLFAYEYFDLWSSPWLTAWLMVGYFAAALLADTFFPAGTFCKYLCPLGNFNFALSSVSPTQITAKDPTVCLSCEGKYCLNGRSETPQGRFTALEFDSLTALPMLEGKSTPARPAHKPAQSFPGCETKLYVPQITSNTDCTLCLNCLRACPHDNVALELRPASHSWLASKPKPDWALLGILFLFGGMSNAFAMIEPFFTFATALANTLNLHNSAFILLLMMVLVLGGGTLITLGVLRLSSGMLDQNNPHKQARGENKITRSKIIQTDLRIWGNIFFPITFAMWAGHYSYHFMTGFLSIVPVTQNVLSSLGIWHGTPNWAMAGIIPENWLFPVQIVILYAGYGASLYIAFQVARANQKLTAMIPIFVWLSICAVLAVLILGQPMQMRGTLLNT